jgi:hypothetical protein
VESVFALQIQPSRQSGLSPANESLSRKTPFVESAFENHPSPFSVQNRGPALRWAATPPLLHQPIWNQYTIPPSTAEFVPWQVSVI